MAAEVFVLGAGASAAACGLPVTRGVLLQAVLRFQAGGYSDEYSSDLKIVLEEAGCAEVLRSRSIGAGITPEVLSGLDAETLLSRYQATGLPREEEALKRVLYSLLGSRDNDGPGLYADLVHTIPAATSAPCGIITFNYDLNVDLAWAARARREDIPWSYGVEFEAGISEEFPSYRRLCTDPPALYLLKLHGSFGFLRCRCGGLRLEFYRGYKPEQGFVQGCGRCGSTAPFSPVLLAPVHEKRPPTELASAWYIARELLSSSTALTVIGYSFPEGDQHVREAFSEALGSNSARDRLTIVDTSLETRQKILGLFEELFTVKIESDSLKDFIGSRHYESS